MKGRNSSSQPGRKSFDLLKRGKEVIRGGGLYGGREERGKKKRHILKSLTRKGRIEAIGKKGMKAILKRKEDRILFAHCRKKKVKEGGIFGLGE